MNLLTWCIPFCCSFAIEIEGLHFKLLCPISNHVYVKGGVVKFYCSIFFRCRNKHGVRVWFCFFSSVGDRMLTASLLILTVEMLTTF